MVFSSILFLFRFMPIAFILYYLTPKRFKNLLLILLSLVFYSWGEVRYFPIMLASIAVDYICSNCIEKNRDKPAVCRFWLLVSVVFNLGMLGFFKYAGFFARTVNQLTGLMIPILNLTLPLGISFYTFQTMSYTIDVYRNKVQAEKNLVDFGAFVVLFPQLIAGPIVRFTDINRELKERTVHLDQIASGVRTFIRGMASKVLIANNIGLLWTQTQQAGFADLSAPMAFLAITAFAFQLYFDFSGYSLMAIGLGQMLGFEFPQNFNYPFISKSMSEFWRRWHMTLGSWFKEYLYIPLGGSRKGEARTILNLFIVWFATGLWHGAEWNFVAWGLYIYVVMLLEKYWIGKFLDKHPVCAHLYMIPILTVSWVLFGVLDFGQIGLLLSRLVSFTSRSDWVYALRNYGVTFVLAFLFSSPRLPTWFKKAEEKSWLAFISYAFLTLASVAYLVDSTYNPFLYFRF